MLRMIKRLYYYSVSRKKATKMFSVIFYKTRAILVKFGTPFPE